MVEASVQRYDRRTGIIVGVLFIVATSFLFLGETFYKTYLDAPEVLEIAAAHKATVLLGLTIELICILAMPLIGAFIFPVLSRVSVGMALAYFFFRAFEAVVLVAVALSNKLALLSLSEAVLAGSDMAGAEASVALIRAQNTWADTAGILYNLIFVAGALCLYSVLFRARLVPRWIPLWGILSAGVLGALAMLGAFTRLPPLWEAALIAPLAIQEMVMALWFIFRGFDTSRLPEMRVALPGGAR